MLTFGFWESKDVVTDHVVLGKTPCLHCVILSREAITQLLRTAHMIVLKKAIAELSEQTTETMDP